MSLEINQKLQEIKKAVEACGVIVRGVTFTTTLKDVELRANNIPQIVQLSLDVTFQLELSAKSQKRLS